MTWNLSDSSPTLDSGTGVATLDGWSAAVGSGSNTFIWVPSYGSEVESTVKLWEAPFGDGYTQRAAVGINNIGDQWSLQFNTRGQAEKEAIKNFLRARRNGQAFDWTPFGESTPVRVLCRQFKVAAEGYNAFNISCTFERVYGE